jgi:phosphohistidine phosphatase
MKLYFMRHGKAVDATLMENDAERPLTDKGAKRVRRIANFLASMQVNPSVIYASPRVRAQQTATIVAEALSKTVTTRNEVNFEFNPEDVKTLIANYSHDSEIMFVGHNPSMSEVASAITGARITLEVGAIICANVTPYNIHDGELAWAINWSLVKAIEE